MNLFHLMLDLERQTELHEARILILLNAFAGENGTETIDGLTKLAKLDFLLRYPVYLERALESKQRSLRGLNIQDHERASIESKMVRFRYGPWDHRYNTFLNNLSARGLAHVLVEGRSVVIGVTPIGRDLAQELKQQELFSDTENRAQILHRHFNLRGTNLKNFIYGEFPEIVNLKLGEEITR